MRKFLPLFALGLAPAGCGNDPPASVMDLVLDSAALSDPEVTAGGVAMGGIRITAHLHAVDTTGGTHDFPVVLSGMSLGGVGIWSTELNDATDSLTGIGISIQDAHHSEENDGGYSRGEDVGSSGPPTIGDLFESYVGAGFGLHVTIGGAIYYFTNDADVVIWLGGLTPGFGINWGLVGGLRMAIVN